MRYLCLFFIILFLKTSAQTQIKGLVLSETKKPVSNANVILSDPQGNIITFVFSNNDGSFLLNTDKFGQYNIQVNAMGFISSKFPVSITKREQTLYFENIILETDKLNEIREIVISKTRPITIRKDTIEYSAKRFATGTEQNVEELLKKLPGITVLSDGKIKFENKEVSRVLLENDDIFEKGYQTLTQNMPSSALDKVQVVKNYSKNKYLRNIEPSESIALNLTLKEDNKGRWFGNVILASTSYKENMRQGKLNLMNFTKRQKVYLLLNANNLGLNEMKGIEYLTNPSSDNDVENVGTNVDTPSIINLHQKNLQFDDNRTNFNNDRLVSFSYIYNFKTDWKLKFVTVFNETENRNYISSLYKFNFSGLGFINAEEKIWKQNNTNGVTKVELTKEFNNNSNLQFYNNFSSLNKDNDNIFLFNGQINNQIGNNKFFASENRLTYTKRIDSSKALVATARYIFQNRPFHFTDENGIFSQILNNPEAQKIGQTADFKMNFQGLKVSYLKKYAEDHSLELQVGNEFRKDLLRSDLHIFNSDNEPVSFDKSGFTNHTDYIQNNVFAKIKYDGKIKNWNYGFTVLNLMIYSDLNQDKQRGFYISPLGNIRYGNRKTGNFNLYAGRKFSTPGISDVYTHYIYQGNRNFKQNDAKIAVLPEYHIGFSYNIGTEMSQYLNFSINLSKLEDYFSNNMIINPNYIFNRTILAKNNTNITASLELKKYLKPLRSRLSILSSHMQSAYESSVNNQPLIKTEFTNWIAGFEMKSGWSKFINYECGYEWTFNDISSKINAYRYTDQKGFINLYFNISTPLRIESFAEYYKFGNTKQRPTQFWDIKINYTLSKYNMSIYIKGNNLLNSDSIQKYAADHISESLYTQRLLPRRIVLGVNKNF